MRIPQKLTVVAALLAPLFHVQAQTLLSDFSSGANWDASQVLFGSQSSWSIVNGEANYSVSSSSDNEFAFRGYTGALGSTSSSWSAWLDVKYVAPSSIFTAGGVAQAINVGLMVVPTGSAITWEGNNAGFNGFMLNSNLFQGGLDTYSREIRSSVFAQGFEPADEETRYAQSPVAGGTATLSTLRISYDAGTGYLSGSFDADGGNTWVQMDSNTLGPDFADTAGWGATSFSIFLVGNSLYDGGTTGVGPEIAVGEVVLDNFYGSGALTAVPEPSTYAAIFGAAALGLAAWRRKQRKANVA